MDLNDINAGKMEEGAELRLRHPQTGDILKGDDGEPMTITVMGRGSKVFRNYQRKKNNERFNAQALKREVDFFPDDDERCEILADLTINWSNIIKNGSKLPFSRREAKLLYLEHLWIADQVDEFINEDSNFFTSPSGGQSDT